MHTPMISCPPPEEPPRITIPAPLPAMTPPTKQAARVSCMIGVAGTGTNASAREAMPMDTRDLKQNSFPTTL